MSHYYHSNRWSIHSTKCHGLSSCEYAWGSKVLQSAGCYINILCIFLWQKSKKKSQPIVRINVGNVRFCKLQVCWNFPFLYIAALCFFLLSFKMSVRHKKHHKNGWKLCWCPKNARFCCYKDRLSRLLVKKYLVFGWKMSQHGKKKYLLLLPQRRSSILLKNTWFSAGKSRWKWSLAITNPSSWWGKSASSYTCNVKVMSKLLTGSYRPDSSSIMLLHQFRMWQLSQHFCWERL